MDALTIVSELVALLESGAQDRIESYLDALDLEALPINDTLPLLIFLLTVAHRCLEARAYPTLRVLTKRWRSLIDDRGGGSVRVLLLAADIEIPVLHALLAAHQEWQSLDVIIDLINAQLPETSNTRVLARVEALLPGQTEEWQLLHQSLDSNERLTSVGKYVRRRAQQWPSYILKPTTLSSHRDCTLPCWRSILPDVLEAVDQLWALAQQYGIGLEDPEDYDCARRRLELNYRISTEEEKYQQLQSLGPIEDVQSSIETEREIFRWLGPVNPPERSSEISKLENELCDRFGCRMLTCDEYEEEVGEHCDYDGASWFRGQCDHCRRTISRLHHAVRLPLLAGGWRGCYCGWLCVSDDNPNEGAELYYLLGRFQTQLREIGLWDRYD